MHSDHSNKSVELELRLRDGARSVHRLEAPIQIGRGDGCNLQVIDPVVSGNHALISFDHTQQAWTVTDLDSRNGTLVEGQRITSKVIEPGSLIELGSDGPQIYIQVLPERRTESVVQDRTVAAEPDQTHRQERLMYLGAMLLILMLTGGALFYAFHKDSQVAELSQGIDDLFYSNKVLELQLAELSQQVAQTADEDTRRRLIALQARKREMDEQYNHLVRNLNIYEGLPPDEQLIVRMARILGESETQIPPQFMETVKQYIRQWQSSSRLEQAVERANRYGYTEHIAESMLQQGLPPQFFYLALQESNFDLRAVGPPTRFGYAKGMWQFIPGTATQYGLEVGPLEQFRDYDPADERHDFRKSTQAAATYLRFIYTTEAQASALLVMASYNWGEHRVGRFLRTLPEHPRDRNFWKLITEYRDRVPDETYDYVLNIFSAAVIGEDPALFGMSFSNPLAAYQ